MSRPPLIGFIADITARTPSMLENLDYLKSLPFDGMVVNIPGSWSANSPGAVLTEADIKVWLDPQTPLDEAYRLLQPPPDDLLEMVAIGRSVNKVAHDGPEVQASADEAKDASVQPHSKAIRRDAQGQLF